MSSSPSLKSLFATGRKHFAKKAYAEALKAWKEAQAICRQTKQKREEGIVGIYISHALKALGKNKEALISATQSVRILRETDDPISLRRALVAMGRLLLSLDYIEEASRAFSQAAAKQSKTGPDKEQVQLLLEAGSALASIGQLGQSQIQYSEAIELSKAIGEAELQADALAAKGQLLLQIGETQQAQEVFQEISQLSDRLANPALKAPALLGLAEVDITLGKFDDAETNVLQAQQILEKTGGPMRESMAQYYLAIIILRKGQPNDALKLAEKASRTFKQRRSKVWQAKSQVLVGQILMELEQKRKALEAFDQAIKLFSQVKAKAQSTWARVEKGKALLSSGQERAAEKEFGQALRYYHELKHGEEEARIYLEIAEYMNRQEKYDEAREHCLQAIQQLKDRQDEEREIQAYQILFQVAQGRTRFEEDLALLQEGLERAKVQKKSLLAASISVNLAQLKISSDSPDKAVTILKDAIGDEHLPREQKAEANLNLGLALIKQRKFAEAIEPLQEAIAHFDPQQKHSKAIAYYNLSEALKQTEQRAERIAALEGAMANLPPSVDEKLQARLSLDLAPFIASKDADRAIQYYKQALKFYEKWDMPLERFTALIGEATLLSQKKQHDEALEYVTQALLLAEELDIPVKPTSKSFIYLQQAEEIAILVALQKWIEREESGIIEKIIDWSTRRKVAKLLPLLPDNLGFEKCSELPTLFQKGNKLFLQAAKLRMDLKQLPRNKAKPHEFTAGSKAIRSLLNNFLNEININRNVISAACLDPGKCIPPRDYRMLQKIIALMPPKRRWIMINFDMFRKRNQIIVTIDDHISRHAVHTLPISQDLISLILKIWSMGKTNELLPATELEDIGINLYRSLLPTSLKKELTEHSYDYIQIITDEFLHHVPFELLFDGHQYWGLKYPINWAPNLQFLESTLKTQAISPQETHSSIFGGSTGPREHPARKRKAEEILQSFLSSISAKAGGSESTLLFEQDFTRQEFAKACREPRTLIYLSTPTSIHHSKGEITLNQPDSLRAIEIGVTTKFEGAPIVVLDEAKQLDPLENGLSLATFLRRFVAAGATSIVFTRYLPNPQIQPHFTKVFTHRVYERDPIAVALLNTRRELANMQRSPNSWLPYTLAGNPFATLY
ncbi:MAG: tetratricopeptide repeat protein [Promethearchaeota archaeon]